MLSFLLLLFIVLFCFQSWDIRVSLEIQDHYLSATWATSDHLTIRNQQSRAERGQNDQKSQILNFFLFIYFYLLWQFNLAAIKTGSYTCLIPFNFIDIWDEPSDNYGGGEWGVGGLFLTWLLSFGIARNSQFSGPEYYFLTFQS